MEKAVEVLRRRLSGVFFLSPAWMVNKRDVGKLLIFTSGVFDRLHIGHMDFFKRARERFPNCQIVISIDSDILATAIKGENLDRQPELWRSANVYEYCVSLFGVGNVFITIHESVEQLHKCVKEVDPDIFFFSIARGGGNMTEIHRKQFEPLLSSGHVHVFSEVTEIFTSNLIKKKSTEA